MQAAPVPEGDELGVLCWLQLCCVVPGSPWRVERGEQWGLCWVMFWLCCIPVCMYLVPAVVGLALPLQQEVIPLSGGSGCDGMEVRAASCLAPLSAPTLAPLFQAQPAAPSFTTLCTLTCL